MNIRTILLPVDGSENSDRAAAYAMDMAKFLDAEIVALHCQPPVPAYWGEPQFREATQRRLDDAERLVAPYDDMLKASGVRYKILIVEGAPHEAIGDSAKAEKADLIIMGTKGRSNLGGLFLGSVTHRVLHTSTCPVLVVR